jgi:hypothetical protein
VPQAHIEIINLSTSSPRRLQTDYKGDLSIDTPIDSYDLTASYDGFKPAKKRIDVPDTKDQTVTLILDVASGNLAAFEPGLRIAEPTDAKLPEELQSESVAPPLQESGKLPYSITISTSPRARIGSEVKLRITTKNISDETIYHISHAGGPRRRNLDISFRDREGRSVQETPLGRKLHGTDPVPWSGSVFTARDPIKPGDVLEEDLSLTEEYNLTRLGEYLIQVLRSDIVTDEEIKSHSTRPLAVVKSNTITLTLVR